MPENNSPRSATSVLILSIIIDIIGVLTYLIPFVGETIDVVWAPISAYIVYQMYGNGLFAIANLVEELAPGLDFVPTATIAWFVYFGRNQRPPNQREE